MDERTMEQRMEEEKMMNEKTSEEKMTGEGAMEDAIEERTGRAGRWKIYLRLPVLLAGYFVLLVVLLCLETGSIFNLGKMYIDSDVLIMMLVFLTAILVVSGMGRRFLRGWQIALGFEREKGYSMSELRRDMDTIRFTRMTGFAVGGIISMVNLVDLLYHMDDIAILGESIANSILSFFYAFAFMLFLLPIEGRLRELLMGYMEDGTDEEPAEDEQTLYFRLRGMGLTDREAEVARLVARDLSNKDIGRELCISDGTVKKHITHILEKTGCSGRENLAEMVRSRRN